MFGLGSTPGNFTTAVSTPAINALVEQQNEIPSYTYGYTAGATYRKSRLGIKYVDTNFQQSRMASQTP